MGQSHVFRGLGGTGGEGRIENATYTNNKRNGFTYDAAGHLTIDLAQTVTYDATGQQATASFSGYLLQQAYDGDRLRVKKVDNGVTAEAGSQSELDSQSRQHRTLLRHAPARGWLRDQIQECRNKHVEAIIYTDVLNRGGKVIRGPAYAL